MRPDPRQRNAPHGGTGRGAAELGGRLQQQHNPRDALLQALESATGRAPSRSGQGSRSRCPSCGGKSEKLSIGEASNGAVLLNAFCGCSPAAVLGACGLTLAHLFPARLDALTPEARRAARQAMREATWRAALDVLCLESKIVAIASRDLVHGQPLSPEDVARVAEAADRIDNARGVLNAR